MSAYPFSLGVEIEIFLKDDKGLIVNADRYFTDKLGVSIDQRSTGEIKLHDSFCVRTDGTPMELQFYYPHPCGHFESWAGAYNANLATAKRIVHDRVMDIRAFVSEENGDKFAKDIGNVYSSGKELINAYTGERTWQDKKEEIRKVSWRSAGLHFHFGISPVFWGKDKDTPEKRTAIAKEVSEAVFKTFTPTRDLIKIADEILMGMGPFSKETMERWARYQTLGIFRVNRNTKSGMPTFEYRQPDPTIPTKTLVNFLREFGKRGSEYIKGII